MLCGPKGSEQNSNSMAQCSMCGRGTELKELPGRSEKYCLECSADMATSILLITEIDAATLAGRFGFDIRTPAFWRASLDIVRQDIDRFESLVGERG